MKSKKLFTLFVGLAICITTLSVNASEDLVVAEPPVRPVKAIKVGTAEPFAGKIFPGIAKATQEVNLSFRVSGTLQELTAKKGQAVHVGDVLVRLDPRDYEVKLTRAKAQLSSAEAAFTNADLEYKRAIGLQETGSNAISQSTVDKRFALFETEKANVEVAKAEVATADSFPCDCLHRRPLRG